MADLKTNLRELSVLLGVYTIVNKEQYIYDSSIFLQKIKRILSPKNHEHLANLTSITFDEEHRKILSNGYKLADKIVKSFHIDKILSMNWFGYDAYKEDPIDISINEYDFSLKEESFILENMGLYKLVNLFTGSNFNKLHIFEDYAPEEYETWFKTTLGLLVAYLSSHNNEWVLVNNKKRKEAQIILKGNQISLIYKLGATTKTSTLDINDGLKQFNEKTSSVTREQVFSKWINEEISNNSQYLKVKSVCSVNAAENLTKYLKSHLNYLSGLPRFLRIHEKEYYYAKTTDVKQSIYKVPSLKNYTHNLEIESIEGSVPSSQVNIITTIRNKKTNRRLVLRNECRFSHGQFNGTPEAKMYYERGNSLLIIYDEV